MFMAKVLGEFLREHLKKALETPSPRIPGKISKDECLKESVESVLKKFLVKLSEESCLLIFFFISINEIVDVWLEDFLK